MIYPGAIVAEACVGHSVETHTLWVISSFPATLSLIKLSTQLRSYMNGLRLVSVQTMTTLHAIYSLINDMHWRWATCMLYNGLKLLLYLHTHR